MVFVLLNRAPEEPWQLSARAGASKESLYLQWSCLCWHSLRGPPRCCWCYHFCVLFCTVCTERNLLSWEELGKSTGPANPREHKQKPPWNTSCLLQAFQATSRKAWRCLPTSDIPETWGGQMKMHQFSIVDWPSVTAAANVQIPLKAEYN